MFFFCSEQRIGGRTMSRRRWAVAVAALGAATGATAAQAAETITYSYDARGRLVQAVRTGTVNNNVSTGYQYDKADNRTNKTTTGAP
jgi:YD repeat-containing protein